MIEPEKRKAIYLLSQEGMGVREISRRLRVSRKAARRVIRERGEVPPPSREGKVRIDPDLLRRLHEECDGYKQRIHERLLEEEKIQVAYSTLTRLLREIGIGREPEARSDRVPDEPGAEMQHDTSPYTLDLGGRPTPVIASSLYLRYSKRRYLRFYPRFDRFRMKCFLHEALTWVPGKDRHDVKIIEYGDRLKIYRGRELLVEYPLPPDGTRNACLRPEGEPRPRHEPKHRHRPTLEEEKRLRAIGPVVGTYLDSEWTPRGPGRHRFLRELFRLSGRMTPALFVRTIERALKYRIADLETIWRIALMHVQDGLDALPAADLDESFTEREAYQEGYLSDEPDFTRYDDLSEEENDGC